MHKIRYLLAFASLLLTLFGILFLIIAVESHFGNSKRFMALKTTDLASSITKTLAFLAFATFNAMSAVYYVKLRYVDALMAHCFAILLSAELILTSIIILLLR